MRVFGQVLTGLGPVPLHLGRFFAGKGGDVTGLAGDRTGVVVQPLVVVRLLGVTVGAVDLVLVVHAHRDRAPGHVVMGRAVTVGAGEVQLAHVDIQLVAGEQQRIVQVAMLDRIAAAALEVTTAAVLARRVAHAFGHGHQVHPFGGIPGIGLDIRAGIVVADQTVHVGFDAKVVVRILPAIPRMTCGAGRPVGRDADAEVVEQVLFAAIHRLVVTGQRVRAGFPRPVRCLHHLLRRHPGGRTDRPASPPGRWSTAR